MPTIYYDETSKFKRKRINKLKRILLIFSLVTFILIIILGASIVTNVFPKNVFSFNFMSSKNKFEFKYYLLVLGTYENYGEAEEVSITSTLLGASGVIWEQDDKYYVLGSAYDSLSDVKSVQKNLSHTEFKTDILTTKIDFASLINQNHNNKNINKIKDTIKFLNNLCNDLIKNSIKLEKKEISYVVASNNLNNMKSDLIEYKNNFEFYFDNSNQNILKLKNCILKIENILDKTINSLIQNDNVNYNIKNCLCKVIRCCYEVNN